MILKKIYIVLFISLLSQTAFTQVTLSASVSKNKLALNERLRVEFSVNKQGADNFEPPNFKNFTIVAGPSSSINQSWINGKTSWRILRQHSVLIMWGLHQ